VELTPDHMNLQVNMLVTFAAATCSLLAFSPNYSPHGIPPVRSTHISHIILQSDEDCQVHTHWARCFVPRLFDPRSSTICHAAIEVGMGTNAFPSSFGCVDQATSAHAEIYDATGWQVIDLAIQLNSRHYPVFLLDNAVVSPRRKSHGIGSDLRSEQWRD